MYIFQDFFIIVGWRQLSVLHTTHNHPSMHGGTFLAGTPEQPPPTPFIHCFVVPDLHNPTLSNSCYLLSSSYHAKDNNTASFTQKNLSLSHHEEGRDVYFLTCSSFHRQVALFTGRSASCVVLLGGVHQYYSTAAVLIGVVHQHCYTAAM